ncbi:Vacuolar protein 8 [Varanus komodoensis]|nr:Vacuolar protein 8 [Varanus komodoensis]
MKPLGEVIRRFGLRSHQYADDTQLCLSFSTNPGEAVTVLNRCLAEVMGWMRANKLKLNPDKTEVLMVGDSSFWVSDLVPALAGVAVPLKDRVHSLGVLLDPELSLEAQVMTVARSAFLQLRLIHLLRPYPEENCLATVTHTLVTSRLDYCNTLYVGLPLKTVRILQMVQNRAARTGCYSYITSVLYQLHWLPIEVQAQFKMLVITYKALNDLGPGYLKEHLFPYMPSHSLRSPAEALLQEPSLKELTIINFFILANLSVKTLSSSLVHDLREHLAQIQICPCLKDKTFEAKPLYKTVLQPQEEEVAQEFLQHIVKVNIQLPPEHLEAYYALLNSNDVEVLQISSLSLVNFLLEGNVIKEHIIQTDLLEPILELLESDDTTVQCNACACIMTLAVSGVNQEAIGAAGGVVPLLVLCKSHDPRVQQNAVGAIFNLTQSEWIQKILFRQGALLVLALLLESLDTEIQYYSCAALSNMATNAQHHEAMLQIGDRFLLRTLLSLLNSSVDKVCNQACICLRNLATSECVQTSIIAVHGLPHLLPLLASDHTEIQQNSIILLRMLSQHPANQPNILICDEVLQTLGKVLLTWKTGPVIIGHAACFIKNLTHSQNIQRLTESPCIRGLLQAVHRGNLLGEESLLCVISCLTELVKHVIFVVFSLLFLPSEGAAVHVLELMDEPLIGSLVRLAGQVEQTEPSFQAAFMIKHISQHKEAVSLLKFHMNKVEQYLMKYLIHQDNRFQQLGLATLCILQKDAELFSSFSQSQLKQHLDQVLHQTEEIQELLNIVIRQMDT